MSLHAKFYACFTKGTIFSLICPAIMKILSDYEYNEFQIFAGN